MRKGFLGILLALAMVFGMTMSAGAIDNIAEPSVGFVVPWVEGDNQSGLDTVVGIQDTPDDADFIGVGSTRTVTWTFFRDSDSAHILDRDFPITPGMVYPFSWNAQKGNNLDGVRGYLVFADPLLSTTTLTANALQVQGLIVAAYVPVLQLRGGYISRDVNNDGIIDVRNSLDGFACRDQDLIDTTWRNWSYGLLNTPDVFGGVNFAPFSGGIYATRVEVDVNNDGFLTPADDIANGNVSTQIPEVRAIGGDRQIFVSPNTAWNGIQPGDIVVPRFSGGPNYPSLDSLIAIWKPDTRTIGGTVQFWNTATENNVSLQFGSPFELVILDPYDTSILGNPEYVEGAVEFRHAPGGWPTPGGIVFTLVDGIVGGVVEETQTLLAPHYPAIP
jgi:hypothetical protein